MTPLRALIQVRAAEKRTIVDSAIFDQAKVIRDC